MNTNREEYIARMSRDLREWSEDIEEYKIRASRGSIGLQADYDKSIRDLQEKRDLLTGKLRELRESTASADTLETDIKTAKRELKGAFEAARHVVKSAA
jgi:DNA repair ATPase RecN